MEGAAAKQGRSRKRDESDSYGTTSYRIRFSERLWVGFPAVILTRNQVIVGVGPGSPNCDDIVVYNRDAIQPLYLVMYEEP